MRQQKATGTIDTFDYQTANAAGIALPPTPPFVGRWKPQVFIWKILESISKINLQANTQKCVHNNPRIPCLCAKHANFPKHNGIKTIDHQCCKITTWGPEKDNFVTHLSVWQQNAMILLKIIIFVAFWTLWSKRPKPMPDAFQSLNRPRHFWEFCEQNAVATAICIQRPNWPIHLVKCYKSNKYMLFDRNTVLEAK